MGKRSQQRMIGLTQEQRIQRAIKRKQEEEERKAKEAVEFAKAMLESSVSATLSTLPVSTRPIMRQLLEIERLAEIEKRKQKP